MSEIEEKFLVGSLSMGVWMAIFYVLDLLFGLDAALLKLSYWVWP